MSKRELKFNSVIIQPKSNGQLDLLTASIFNWLGHWASCPGNRALAFYAELTVSSLAMAVTISRHFAGLRRDGQTELAPGWSSWTWKRYIPHTAI